MKSLLLLLCCVLLQQLCIAANLTGTIMDNNGKLLPYASLTVKGTKKGVVANGQGRYVLELAPGSYTITCQYVGYKTEEKSITLGQENLVVNFTLTTQNLTMATVVVKKGVDPAMGIIRETIRKRDFYANQVDSLTVDVYIKGLLRSRAVPDKFFGQKIDKKEMQKEGMDSLGRGILFLSESVTKVSLKRPDKVKMEVVSSRESGGGFGFSFPSFINFYANNVTLLTNSINSRGFVSPISDNAFHYYRFRYEGDFFEHGKIINRIRVTPRRKFEPLFEGFVNIIDGEWRFHSLELTTTKEYQMELLDTLKVTQLHGEVTNNIWRTQNQVVYVAAKKFGFDITGNFLNVYTNYDLEPSFGKKHFNRVLLSYDTSFNKKDSTYWSRVRPVPLEPDEKRDFVVKDSIHQVARDSMFTRSNIDSLRKNQKPVKLKQFFIGGVRRNYYSSKAFSTYRLEPFIQQLQYNTVEGVVVAIDHSLEVRPRQGSFNYTLRNYTRYGINNQRLNALGELTISPKDNSFRNRYLAVAGGSRVSQFNRDNPIHPLTNAVSTLVYGNNWMKLYENSFVQLRYNNRLENGLQINVEGLYESRRPLENTTDYAFRKTGNKFTPNHPVELANVPFEKNRALVTTLRLSFQPGQRYIQFPRYKVPIGSKYPTLDLEYAKAIPGILDADADFDRWQFSVHDNMNLKLKGEFRYRISAGGFLNKNRVDIPDYTHFIGNRTIINNNYLNSFQLAPYYRYSNTENIYGLVHAEHHFNGLLTNKIPLFKRLKWNLVAGTNTFYVNRDNYYAEVFAGLENIFKLLRVDFVSAYQAAPGAHYGIRVGFSGVLGGMVQLNTQ
ncbi:CarboxypepD_reg-like domain-containing protein [Cnuella takakiae]|uniref:CarboxypepD_reg-like domain-containing protein n=1 Tax=Cnuella takakiae TaxID=1302690 RepID=A0A1M5IVP2_9BACT|nr:DUF5686 and carboxypeptidase regulatory-like domain-containing protein [Cnuella takakiae]OLY91442.1 hypothetical protein BUE76_05640 [Cnuella takakiae]SHG32397.1 CarboxypepD_reg-like domain-containing protein [Cnuella takakiae]